LADLFTLDTENTHRIAAIQNVGKRFAVVDTGVIEVQAPQNASCVRFECWGVGERMAWTQPFFMESLVPGEHGIGSGFGQSEWRDRCPWLGFTP